MPSLVDKTYGERPVDSPLFMVAGVFFGWEANALRPAWSLIWRARGGGAPDWLANTDFTSYFLFILGYGAVRHLLAPGAIGESVPRSRWVNVGCWAGIGVFAAISFSYRDDIATALQWLPPPHDISSAPPRR